MTSQELPLPAHTTSQGAVHCCPKDCQKVHMGVSINGGSLKYLVIMENPMKMDELGVPPFQESFTLITYRAPPQTVGMRSSYQVFAE